MDKATENFFKDHHDLIVKHAAELYGIDQTQVERLGSFESAVYGVTRHGEPFILRATDSEHRTVAQIQAELEWVDYLAAGGVPVCRPLESCKGNLVEPVPDIPDERSCALILFERATGARLKPEECTPDFVERWGEIIGQMHRLTREYQPGVVQRHQWHTDPDLIPPAAIEESQPIVATRIREQIELLKSLPTTEANYGLVHSDLHQGNFFVSDGEFRIFDTDDCHYDFFLNDLAMPLYYTFHSQQIGNYATEFAGEFWGNLLRGYLSQLPLEKGQFGLLPEFLKLREMILYMIIIKEDIADADPWCGRFMQGRRERIENKIPVIDFDFTGP